MIEVVGVEKLRRNLSRYLQRVREEGLILRITRHGQVVADIVPHQPQPMVKDPKTANPKEKP